MGRQSHLPGFSLDDCDPVQVDGVSVPVTWQGEADIRQLAHRPVRLVIEVDGASLYGLHFTDGSTPTSEGMAEENSQARRQLEADEVRG